jgi:hypothetical protein
MSGDRERIASARNTLAEVTGAVRAAQAAIDKGELVDLTGLDRIIAGICAGIRAMPSAQGRQLAPLVADLIARLEELATSMAAQRDQYLGFGGDGGAPSPSGAAAAYRKPRR